MTPYYKKNRVRIKAYARRWYKERRLEIKERRRRAYRERVDWMDAIKRHPCLDCHRKFPPECMDFDHVRGRKSFQISARLVAMSKERVLTEIKKCDLVCANCHRIRTRRRLREQSRRKD